MSKPIKIIDNFKDYDKVLDFYSFLLQYWRHCANIRNVNKGKVISEYTLVNHITILKVFLNSAISKMLRNMEILKKDNSIDENRYLTILKNIYIKLKLDEYIIKKTETLSEDQIIVCIRNAFAHATFKLAITDEKISVIFEDEKIKAVLPLEIVHYMSDIMRDQKMLNVKRDSYLANYFPFAELKTTNQREWQTALNKITKIKFERGLVEYFVPVLGTVPIGTTHLCLSPSKEIAINQEKIDSETKRLVSKYIRYYGEKNWIQIHPYLREELLSLFLNKIINNEFYDVHNEFYLSKPIKNDFVYKTTSEENFFDAALNTPYISPFAFISVFSDYAYYSLNFAKEASTRDKTNEVVYQDIEVQNVEFLEGSESDYVKHIDSPQYLVEERKYLKKERKKLNRKINSCNAQIEGITSNKELTETEKKEKLIILNDTLKEKNKELKDVIQLLKINQKEIDNFKPHYAYTNEFFRRLRNSITHFTYEIDYRKALYIKDFDSIDLILSDSDGADKFKAKINVGELTKIIEILTKRIKQRNPVYYRSDQIEIALPAQAYSDEKLMRVAKETLSKWEEDTNVKYHINEEEINESRLNSDLIVSLFTYTQESNQETEEKTSSK